MTLKEGFAQTVRVPSYGGRGGWPNLHITVTFIVAKKLNLRFILLYFRYLWGSGLVENVIGWGRGLKLLKKPSYDI